MSDLVTGRKSEQRWVPAKDLERRRWNLTGEACPLPASGLLVHTLVLPPEQDRRGQRRRFLLMRNHKSQELVSAMSLLCRLWKII